MGSSHQPGDGKTPGHGIENKPLEAPACVSGILLQEPHPEIQASLWRGCSSPLCILLSPSLMSFFCQDIFLPFTFLAHIYVFSPRIQGTPNMPQNANMYKFLDLKLIFF